MTKKEKRLHKLKEMQNEFIENRTHLWKNKNNIDENISASFIKNNYTLYLNLKNYILMCAKKDAFGLRIDSTNVDNYFKECKTAKVINSVNYTLNLEKMI